MKYNVKVIFSDKIEPTSVIDTDDFEVIKNIAVEKLKLMSNNSGSVSGLFISCEKD